MAGTALRIIIWLILIPVLFIGSYGVLTNFIVSSGVGGKGFLFLAIMIAAAAGLVGLAKNKAHRFISYLIIVLAIAVLVLGVLNMHGNAGFSV